MREEKNYKDLILNDLDRLLSICRDIPELSPTLESLKVMKNSIYGTYTSPFTFPSINDIRSEKIEKILNKI